MGKFLVWKIHETASKKVCKDDIYHPFYLLYISCMGDSLCRVHNNSSYRMCKCAPTNLSKLKKKNFEQKCLVQRTNTTLTILLHKYSLPGRFLCFSSPYTPWSELGRGDRKGEGGGEGGLRVKWKRMRGLIGGRVCRPLYQCFPKHNSSYPVKGTLY